MSDTAPAPLPAISRKTRASDAAYEAAVALIERYVDPVAQFELKRAVILYGVAEAKVAIDTMTGALGAPAGRE